MVFWDQKQEKLSQREHLTTILGSSLLPRDTELLYTVHNGLCAIGEHEL